MKIKLWLKDTTNEVFPKCRLFYQLPKGNKKLSNWYPEVLEHAQCPLEDCVERTAREAVAMQTSSALSSARLRKKALTDGPDFKTLVKLGCTLEKADKHASTMMVTEPLCSVNNRDAYAGGGRGAAPPPALCRDLIILVQKFL